MNEYEQRLLAHLEHHGELLAVVARSSKEVGVRENVKNLTDALRERLKAITEYWHHRL